MGFSAKKKILKKNSIYNYPFKVDISRRLTLKSNEHIYITIKSIKFLINITKQ